MYRVKSVEEIFCPFSLYEAALAIVHVQRKKGEACLPLIDQPAAANYSLGWLMWMQPVHDQKKYKALISVIRLEKIGHSQKGYHADKLHRGVFLKMLDQAERKISKE